MGAYDDGKLAGLHQGRARTGRAEQARAGQGGLILAISGAVVLFNKTSMHSKHVKMRLA